MENKEEECLIIEAMRNCQCEICKLFRKTKQIGLEKAIAQKLRWIKKDALKKARLGIKYKKKKKSLKKKRRLRSVLEEVRDIEREKVVLNKFLIRKLGNKEKVFSAEEFYKLMSEFYKSQEYADAQEIKQ